AHLAGRDDEVRYAPRRPTGVKGVAEPIRFVEVLPTVELAPPPPLPRSLKRHKSRRRTVLLVAGAVLLAAAVPVAAIQLRDGDTNPTSFRTIASDRCGPLHYAGAGSPQVLIAADLPLQPGVLATSTPMVDAMTLALRSERCSWWPALSFSLRPSLSPPSSSAMATRIRPVSERSHPTDAVPFITQARVRRRC